MWRMMLAGFVMALILAGCGGEPQTASDEPTAPDSVQWNRDPLAIIFRAFITGGNPPEYARNNSIPECTLYGDGRVVFARSNSRTGDNEIIFDIVDDRTIEEFVYQLIVQNRLFTYDEGLARQAPQVIQPVYEQIILEVNNTRHVTDFYADWPSAYFTTVVDLCRGLAQTPRLFRPSGAWISVQPVELDLTRPYHIWEPEATGFSLTGLGADGTKRWIEGGIAEYLWDQVIVPPIPVWFVDNGVSFAVSVQVPGITLDAPAAPAQ